MYKSLILGIVLSLVSLTVGHAQDVVAFVHANVIDGQQERVLENQTVLVYDGRITQMGAGDISVPVGATIIDLQNQYYLLPGFMDAHVHIASIAAAERALASGVTTARSASTGGYQDVTLREMVKAGALAGPEVLAAGTFVTPHLGDRVLADPRLVPLHEGVESDEALRHLVQINAARGVDVIKTRGTERAGLPHTDPRKQVYTEHQLRVIVEEANSLGLSVLCHAHGDEGARAAVRAGVRSIEHGTYLSPTTLALMKTQGTYLVPTYTIVTDLLEPGGDYDNPILRMRGQHMEPRLAEVITQAHALGIPVVASTDTGYGPESIVRVGTEMMHFVRFGMTPFEAIQSATTIAADLFNIADRTGTLEVGKEADMVVLASNPLADIRAVQDVLLVMSNGLIAINRLPFGK